MSYNVGHSIVASEVQIGKVLELRSILERSRLQGWRIAEDFMDVMIVKEA